MSKPTELRFTRTGQASTFAVASAVLLALAVCLYLLARPGVTVGPLLKTWWPAAIALGGAIIASWKAVRLPRTLYLAFTSIGLEIYPFFRPERGSQLVAWAEIKALEVDSPKNFLVVSLRGEGGSKIFITLDPLGPAARQLLEKAVIGVAKQLPQDENITVVSEIISKPQSLPSEDKN